MSVAAASVDERPTPQSAELAQPARVRVLKFGGSSLATPQRITEVGRIILSSVNGSVPVVVVSAFQEVTNQLLECAALAERRDARAEQLYEGIADRHRSTVDALLTRTAADQVRSLVDEQLEELRDALRGIRLLAACPAAALDIVASFGERLSAVIVAGYLNRFRPARFVDARAFVTTDEQFTRASVNLAKTNRAAGRFFSAFWRDTPCQLPVVTGFIGQTGDGRTTTIGRNGSDCTAAILAAALGASVVEIWTDVDGILSADPHVVPSAFVLSRMSYEEAMEMSVFGAKVLHPGTIGPVLGRSIPIVIKNTFNPSARGTLVSRRASRAPHSANGVSAVRDVALLTLRGHSSSGAAATSERVYRALALSGAQAIFSSHASWEQSISLGVAGGDASTAAKALGREFRLEIDAGLMTLDRRAAQTMIAVVGGGEKGRAEAAGKVLGSLGRHDIPVRAVVHGATDRSVSCVVDGSQRSRAINVIHRGLFETRRSLALVVIGVGGVGGELLRQICDRRQFLLEHQFDARVVGIADSKHYVLNRDGIDLGGWRSLLDGSDRLMDSRALTREIAAMDFANAAVVDCTASRSIADAYPEFVRANLHIISSNKLANVLPWRRYSHLRRLLTKRRRHFLYETNVGAGLPVISTLRDLVASGDPVRKIEGVFSGTLGSLFSAFDGSIPFSALVREARRAGYTEPDPREDLSGQDVARKLLILARQIGLKMDLEEVSVESLLPEGLETGAFSDEFFSRFAAHDAAMAERLASARSRGTVLRYVGTLQGGRAAAELREFPRDHRFGSTLGGENVIAVTTDRYSRTPLVIQGPGAGAEVTAMGIFSDILKLLHYLPPA